MQTQHAFTVTLIYGAKELAARQIQAPFVRQELLPAVTVTSALGSWLLTTNRANINVKFCKLPIPCHHPALSDQSDTAHFPIMHGLETSCMSTAALADKPLSCICLSHLFLTTQSPATACGLHRARRSNRCEAQ